MRSLVVVCVAMATACSSARLGSPDAGEDATTTDDAPTFGDGALPDLGLEDVPTIALDAGGPFLCFGCVCNGADHFCLGIEVGDHHDAPLTLDAGLGDASMCSPDAATGCVAIPAQCATAPTCVCLLNDVGLPGCDCKLDPSENGLDVGCILP